MKFEQAPQELYSANKRTDCLFLEISKLSICLSFARLSLNFFVKSRIFIKALFYLKSATCLTFHRLISTLKHSKCNSIIERHSFDNEYLDKVNYYCKRSVEFDVSEKSEVIKNFTTLGHPSLAAIDLLNLLQYFERRLKFDCYLKDYGGSRTYPTLVKCRPINNSNELYVLLKLNTYRFFNYPRDNLAFSEKSNSAIFRGGCHRQHRKNFVEFNYKLHHTDIRDTSSKSKNLPFYSPYTPIKEQLRNKFIISIEGNDVASNLPWIMASNSIAFMAKPKFEGWFMQGRLIPNHHYVLLKDDYSDLAEKIDYYSSNDDEALEINQNAKKHVAQFFDKKSELITSLLVLDKYFRLSGQID